MVIPWLNWGINVLCTHVGMVRYVCLMVSVDKRTHFLPVLTHQFCTVFAQALGIKALPYFGHLLADHKIKLNSFFYLFNRMDGGGVVFAPELLRNFRERHV